MNLDRTIYRAVVLGSRLSVDGETPAVVAATREANGWAVWYVEHAGNWLMGWWVFGAEPAIECAVTLAHAARGAVVKLGPKEPADEKTREGWALAVREAVFEANGGPGTMAE